MKKITIAVLIFLGTFSMASAELGVNLGVSTQMGIFHATGQENENGEIAKDNATGVFGYSSYFIEKTLWNSGFLSRFAVGYDWVADGFNTDTSETVREDDVAAVPTKFTNTVKVNFDNLETLYGTFHITDSIYVMYGNMSVDVTTKESLATGSKYGNTSLDGTTYGVGFDQPIGERFFIRGEGTMMEFDGVKLTSSTNADNSVSLNDLDGASAKLSIGVSF
tara:strand:- start:526 stop:1188 length:663 start_codon:yes stop_codon:yes gene_type:complete